MAGIGCLIKTIIKSKISRSGISKLQKVKTSSRTKNGCYYPHLPKNISTVLGNIHSKCIIVLISDIAFGRIKKIDTSHVTLYQQCPCVAGVGCSIKCVANAEIAG